MINSVILAIWIRESVVDVHVPSGKASWTSRCHTSSFQMSCRQDLRCVKGHEEGKEVTAAWTVVHLITQSRQVKYSSFLPTFKKPCSVF